MLLEIRDVRKSFGGLTAVAGVSMTLHKGAVVSIIGPNGAGKTTLFNLISGAIRPDRGKIFFKGVDITGMKPHELCRRGLARSFQVTNIFQHLTVFENIRLAAQGRMRGLGLFISVGRWREPYKEAERVLSRLGIWEYRHELAGNLSHGNQRHLEIGLALATRPELLLLDEPTAGMSPEETRAMIDLLKDIRKDVTLVLIEHDLEVVFEVSDQVTVLHQGRILAQGPPDAVKNNPEVQAAYLGEPVNA